MPEVRIQFTVADERGHLLDSLVASELNILDNRLVVPSIHDFARLDNLPIQVSILLDISDSVAKSLQQESQITQYFLERIFRPQMDSAAILVFGRDVMVLQQPTASRDLLVRALAKPQQAGYVTSLFDAIEGTCRDQFPIPADLDRRQRIILLITDGADTGSRHTLTDAITAAQRHDVQVFAISIHSPKSAPAADDTLVHLAEATGGRFYVVSSPKSYPAIFASMEQQIRTQYSVSFPPASLVAGAHEVSIGIAGNTKLHVHARHAYFYEP